MLFGFGLVCFVFVFLLCLMFCCVDGFCGGFRVGGVWVGGVGCFVLCIDWWFCGLICIDWCFVTL